MSDENKPEEPSKEILQDFGERDLNMFIDSCQGMKVKDIAIKYGLSESGVYYVAERDRWRERRKKYKEARMKKYGQSMTDEVINIGESMIKQARLIRDKTKANPSYVMTAEERGFMFNLYDRLTKEVKLDQNKPTEITESKGVVEYHVKLPPGVDAFGVIPPPPNVKQIKTTEEEVQKLEEKEIFEDDDI